MGGRRLAVAVLSVPLLAGALSVRPAEAQSDGFRIRGHLGGGQVEALLDRDDLDRTGVGLVGGVGVDWPLSDRFRLGLELERHRLFEGAPATGEPSVGLDGILGTTLLLATVQLRLGPVHVRPGLGLSRHSFATGVESGGEIVFAGASGEVGTAAGVALGAEIGRAGPFTFLTEGLARWTDGEDSTSGRRSLALTVGAAFRP